MRLPVRYRPLVQLIVETGEQVGALLHERCGFARPPYFPAGEVHRHFKIDMLPDSTLGQLNSA